MKKELDYTAFLDELTKLTKKYHIEIGGCGCCGSPFLNPVKPKNDCHYVVTKDNGKLTLNN